MSTMPERVKLPLEQRSYSAALESRLADLESLIGMANRIVYECKDLFDLLGTESRDDDSEDAA